MVGLGLGSNSCIWLSMNSMIANTHAHTHTRNTHAHTHANTNYHGTRQIPPTNKHDEHTKIKMMNEEQT